MKSIVRNFIAVPMLFFALSFTSFSAFALNMSGLDDKKKDVEEVTFIVNIDCPNCVKKVEEKLPFEKGVRDMKVVLEDRTVWIQYSSKKTNKARLAAAIERIGYKVLGEKEVEILK